MEQFSFKLAQKDGGLLKALYLKRRRESPFNYASCVRPKVLRSNPSVTIWVSLGRAPLPSALVNPDSKLNTIINRKTKRLYVAFNDETIATTSTDDGGGIKGTSEDIEQTAGGKKRDELVIAHSDDDGENLYIFARIDEGVTPSGVMIHYPTMAFYDDQELLVTYSISYNNATNFVGKSKAPTAFG